MKRGQPTKYTNALADEICKQLAEGNSLRKIVKKPGMPSMSMIMRWLHDHPYFWEHYTKSREIYLDLMAEEVMEISDDGSNDWMESNDPDNPGYRFNGEHHQRSRLRVDSRKWYLSKLAPKRYGDRIQTDVNHSGNIGFSLNINTQPEPDNDGN